MADEAILKKASALDRGINKLFRSLLVGPFQGLIDDCKLKIKKIKKLRPVGLLP